MLSKLHLWPIVDNPDHPEFETLCPVSRMKPMWNANVCSRGLHGDRN